jgi:hypothetical protein
MEPSEVFKPLKGLVCYGILLVAEHITESLIIICVLAITTRWIAKKCKERRLDDE